MRSGNTFVVLGTCLGALAVVLGAFGAHALKTRLSPEHLQVFETGVRYQMYHALALLLLGALAPRLAAGFAAAAGWLFLVGIALFAGSLYLLSTVGWKWLGPVTPLGGLCLIAGWIAFAAAAARGP